MALGSANRRLAESASTKRRSPPPLSVLNRFVSQKRLALGGSPAYSRPLFPFTGNKPLPPFRLISSPSSPRAMSKERFHLLGGGVRALWRGEEGLVGGWLPGARVAPGPTAKKCSEKGLMSALLWLTKGLMSG